MPNRHRPPLPVLVGLTLGVLQLLYFQLSTDSPLRLAKIPANDAAFNTFLKNGDLSLALTAGTANVQFRLPPIPPTQLNDRHRATVLFFNAEYTLYPRRGFVGDGTSIVNSDDQLFAVKPMSDPTWFAAHHVGRIVQLVRTTDGAMFWSR